MSDADKGYYDAEATSAQLDMVNQLNADINGSVNSFFGVPSLGSMVDTGLGMVGQGIGMVTGGMSSMVSSLSDSVMGMLGGQDQKAEGDNKSSSPSPGGMQNIMSNSGGGSEMVEEAVEVVAENPEVLAAAVA